MAASPKVYNETLTDIVINKPEHSSRVAKRKVRLPASEGSIYISYKLRSGFIAVAACGALFETVTVSFEASL